MTLKPNRESILEILKEIEEKKGQDIRMREASEWYRGYTLFKFVQGFISDRRVVQSKRNILSN